MTKKALKKQLKKQLKKSVQKVIVCQFTTHYKL